MTQRIGKYPINAKEAHLGLGLGDGTARTIDGTLRVTGATTFSSTITATNVLATTADPAVAGRLFVTGSGQFAQKTGSAKLLLISQG